MHKHVGIHTQHAYLHASMNAYMHNQLNKFLRQQLLLQISGGLGSRLRANHQATMWVATHRLRTAALRGYLRVIAHNVDM